MADLLYLEEIGIALQKDGLLRNALLESVHLGRSQTPTRLKQMCIRDRILSDVSIIQQAVVWCVTMVLPVPALSLMGIVMAFSIDPSMGMILGGGVVFVVLLTVVISKKAASVFGRLPVSYTHLSAACHLVWMTGSAPFL